MVVSHAQRLELTRFVLAVLGVGLLSYGAWLHYAPLGYVVAGFSILMLVLIGMWRR
jgi:membrane protein implicated in regulation of membrane protease activity